MSVCHNFLGQKEPGTRASFGTWYILGSSGFSPSDQAKACTGRERHIMSSFTGAPTPNTQLEHPVEVGARTWHVRNAARVALVCAPVSSRVAHVEHVHRRPRCGGAALAKVGLSPPARSTAEHGEARRDGELDDGDGEARREAGHTAALRVQTRALVRYLAASFECARRSGSISSACQAAHDRWQPARRVTSLSVWTRCGR